MGLATCMLGRRLDSAMQLKLAAQSTLLIDLSKVPSAIVA